MKTEFTLAGILLSMAMSAQSVAGPENAGSASNNTSTGAVAWSNTGNIFSSDNTYSTASVNLGLLSNANTNYLLATGFGFSIPGTAVISGVKVEMEKRYDLLFGLLSSVSDNAIRLVIAGVIGGANRAAGVWPSSDTYSSYGGSADLWGQTWSPADINNSNFGVAVSASISSGLGALTMNTQVDHIRITIYFNVPVPVQLFNFHAAQAGQKTCLQWSTASESNSTVFIAEKMNLASGNWISVDSIPAAGESNELKNYSLYDINPDPVNFYRIREMDVDGKYNFSNTIQVQVQEINKNQLHVYPVPARNKVMIDASSPLQSVALKSFEGRLLIHTTLPGTDNRHEINLENIPTGIYILCIETTDFHKVQEIIVKK